MLHIQDAAVCVLSSKRFSGAPRSRQLLLRCCAGVLLRRHLLVFVRFCVTTFRKIYPYYGLPTGRRTWTFSFINILSYSAQKLRPHRAGALTRTPFDFWGELELPTEVGTLQKLSRPICKFMYNYQQLLDRSFGRLSPAGFRASPTTSTANSPIELCLDAQRVLGLLGGRGRSLHEAPPIASLERGGPSLRANPVAAKRYRRSSGPASCVLILIRYDQHDHDDQTDSGQ